MKVYQAINAVQAELARDGITKDKRNQQQGYNFRGIDDVYNALSPLLAKHGLCILPRILTRTCEERQSAKGGALFYVTVEAEFDFVAAEDGSTHIVRTFGEAMDSGDKATNKAMSAAYKYAAFQAFAIPTEADNDADAHTPQVKHKGRPMDGVWEAQSAESQAWLLKIAEEAEARVANDPDDALDYLASQNLDTDEKAAVASRLGSKTRTALTKAHNAKKATATANKGAQP
jgi:hypothetical protein